MAMLDLQTISLQHGSERILNDVSLRLSASDGLLIQGPNGCGKTSLLNIIAGTQPATSGRITWNGKERSKCSLNLAYLSFDSPLLTELSVVDNLRYWTALYHHTDSSAIMNALSYFGLGQKAFAPALTLSAGERQRLHLSKLLLVPLDLWLLDEVTTHLDTLNQQRFEAALLDIRQEGSIVLCVSHLPLKNFNKKLEFKRTL
jgi:heme exporter protein A